MSLQFEPAPATPTPPFEISGTPYYFAMFNADGNNVTDSQMFTVAGGTLIAIKQPNGAIASTFTLSNTPDVNAFSLFWTEANAFIGVESDKCMFRTASSDTNGFSIIGYDKATSDPFVWLSNDGADSVFNANNSGVRTVEPTGHTQKYWKLGEAEAGAPTPDTTIYVEVDGQVYKIAAELVPPPSLLLLETGDFLLLENNNFIELE
jgi:hypothetical protein